MTNDSITLTGPTEGELEALAGLAESCQADPQRNCVYAGDDAVSIAADVTDVEEWKQRLVVARRGDEPIGWLLGDVDTDMARVWWWGPFVTDADWHTIADRLYLRARELASSSTGIEELGEEMAADARSELFAEFAARHGFDAEEGSACLVQQPAAGDDSAPIVTARHPIEIVELAAEHHEAVARLHEMLFPGTHTTGRALVEGDDERLNRLVGVADDGRVVGYVATELQHDGSLYVDFLGVEPELQGRGIGRALVSAACRAGFARHASHAHLTVRTSNASARALYASLGFVEERVLAPYRRGFTLSSD